jgi:hypothetical protein
MAVQMKMVAIGAIAVNAISISVGAVPLKGSGSDKTSKVGSHKSNSVSLGSSPSGSTKCWYEGIQAPDDAQRMIACPGRDCSNNTLNGKKNSQGVVVGGKATAVGDVKTCTVASNSPIEDKIKSIWSCANRLCDEINQSGGPVLCSAAVATFHSSDDNAPSWGQYKINDQGKTVCDKGCVDKATIEFYSTDFYPVGPMQEDDTWKNWTSKCTDDCYFEGPHCKGDNTGKEKVTYYFQPDF